MKRKRGKRWLSLCLAVILLLAGVTGTGKSEVLAAGEGAYYPAVDGFADKPSLRGIQGKITATDYNISHTLFNLNMNECIYPTDHPWAAKGFILPYTYKGGGIGYRFMCQIRDSRTCYTTKLDFVV